MFSKKQWVIFAAGAAAFHTLSHLVIQYSDTLPIQIYSFELTSQLNMMIILINAVITAGLLWWVSKLK